MYLCNLFTYIVANDNYSVPEGPANDPKVLFQNNPITLELALFLDEPLWKHFIEEFGAQRADQEIVDFSLALMNNVLINFFLKTIFNWSLKQFLSGLYVISTSFIATEYGCDHCSL